MTSQQNIVSQNKPNLPADQVKACHSALDAESNFFEQVWIPAFAGMTAIETHVAEYDLKNKANLPAVGRKFEA